MTGRVGCYRVMTGVVAPLVSVSFLVDRSTAVELDLAVRSLEFLHRTR